jgi:hypothetical protein
MYGVFQRIVLKCKERGFIVERHHIEYRLKMRKQGKLMKNKTNYVPVVDVDNNNGSIILDLTDPILKIM